MPTLEITTMLGCPVMCTFCPQENLRKATEGSIKYLSFDNYVTVLKKIPKHVRIDFSGMSEPWANSDCTKMLIFTLEQGYNVAIYTTLFGLNGFDADLVISNIIKYHSQVKELVVHLQDKNNNMKGLKMDDEWQMVASKFINLFADKLIPNMSFMTMDENGELHPLLAELNHLVDNFNGITRAGSLDISKIEGQKVIVIKEVTGIIKCSRWDYYDHNVLLPNGDVLICCMDYDSKHAIGNLFTDNYYDIFKSEKFNQFMIANIDPSGKNGSTICRKCECAVPAK